jgi:hypothetical protein
MRAHAIAAAHPAVAEGKSPDDDVDVDVTQFCNPITAEGCGLCARRVTLP